MAWYQLTADVMVRGTPRATGEVLDLSVSEGQLLSGLGRATPCNAPTPEAEPACPMPTPAPVEVTEVTPAKAAPPIKPVVRRRSPSPTQED